MTVLLGFLALLSASAPAFAHGDIEPGQDPWAAWQFSPEIVVALLLAAVVYAAGLRRSPRDERGTRIWSHISFYGGLVALYAALQSPIEAIADHVFIVHQVEHMLLRTIGPMLLMLAAPQAVLMRGLPDSVRRGIVAPVAGSSAVQAIFAVLAQPAVATALFIGTTYFWMIPRFHDVAILDEPIHYLWHVTLLVSGLFFFWRLLDPRPYPLGASLPARLLMFWAAVMGNILLGAYLSFKQTVLYGAYDETGRLFGIDALTDETFGGLTMWVSGCMMFALAALAVVHRWAHQESRADSRRARGRHPCDRGPGVPRRAPGQEQGARGRPHRLCRHRAGARDLRRRHVRPRTDALLTPSRPESRLGPLFPGAKPAHAGGKDAGIRPSGAGAGLVKDLLSRANG